MKGIGLISKDEKKLMNMALSEDQLLRALSGHVKIISYSDLKNYRTLESLLKPYNKVIILFAITSPLNGHWTCLHKRTSGEVIFTDSYGLEPMDENHYVPASIVKYVSEQFRPYIYQLFSNYRHPIHYSQYRLQSPNTSVCGRYCIVRLLYPELSEDQFSKVLRDSVVHPDIVVTLLTKDII